MPRLTLVSDTHVPSADRVPEWVRDEIARADHTIHAGDFDSAETLAGVRDLADGELTAVAGNTDSGLDLPTTTTVELGGQMFVVTHGHAGIENFTDLAAVVREAANDPIGVSGHTHSVFVGDVGGVRLLNPGSATGTDPASAASMMVVEIADDEIDVTLRER